MANYWVGDQAGRRLGPVGLDVLRDLIRAGRLVGLDKASRDGQTFAPLVDFPEIAALFTEREAQDRPAADSAEAERIHQEIAALKGKRPHEVFGIDESSDVKAYRASFFALVKRFYPERLPSGASGALRAAYGEMFHFLSDLMVQIESRRPAASPPPGAPPAAAPADVAPAAAAPRSPPPVIALHGAAAPAPSYRPNEFIGWERRTDDRVYCEIRCTLENAPKLFNSHKLINISNGGFFVASKRSPPLGERLNVTLTFDDPARVIQGVAKVVWENQRDARQPFGFGCNFTELKQDDKAFIQAFIKKALDAGFRVP